MSSLSRDFESFEEEFDLFEIEVDGVPVWERVRFRVHREILEQNGVGQAHTKIDKGISDHVEGLVKLLRNVVYRNPFLANPADVMFVGHRRRKKLEDGLWWDLYCDPIHDTGRLDSVHFEKPYRLGHKRPAKTGGLRYLDLIEFAGSLQRRLGFHRSSIPSDVAARLRETEREIANRFDARVDLRGRILESLHIRRSNVWLYERLLERVSPNIVVLVNSYGNECLIEACKNAEVPTVELQHGVIHRDHLGYHYPGDRTKVMFPDYLLTWGEYWNGCVDFPVDGDRVIAVGFPYIEMEREKYREAPSRDQILFISQGTIGTELSKFAVELDELTTDHEVVYKLHPGEYDRWEQAYPWLVDADIHVQDDESVPLYRLFAESRIQVGVHSTAILEGLAFDLDTYLVDLPGIEALEYLYENHYVKVVQSPRQLMEEQGSETPAEAVDTEAFFAVDPLPNTIRAIKRIKDGARDDAVQT